MIDCHGNGLYWAFIFQWFEIMGYSMTVNHKNSILHSVRAGHARLVYLLHIQV